jgi:hypothetical protein
MKQGTPQEAPRTSETERESTGLPAPEHKPGTTALYRFYDVFGQLLYVGITNNLKLRWSQHATTAATWWPLRFERSVEWFDAREDAAVAEVEAITTEGPLHNLSRTPSPMLVSASGAVGISTVDWHAYEGQWVNVAEISRRVGLSRARVMQIAQSDPDWPVPREQWRFIANMWLFPWPLIEPFFAGRDVRQGQRSDLARRDAPDTRGHKLLAVARERFGSEFFSRADLAEISPLSAPGIALNVRALLEQGLIAEVGKRPGASGRGLPHTLFVITPPSE